MNRQRYILVVIVAAVTAAAGVVQANSHDVAWTFGNIDFFSYTLDSFEPGDANLGTPGAEDPTLTLELGKRYEVTVVDPGSHPFEVIAKGSASGGDTNLLSMSSNVTGSFESDEQVGWQGDGTGTVTFTLTEGLYNAMLGPDQGPGYRCGVHVSTMRGDFIVVGAPIAATIEKGSISIELETVASGLTAPVDLKPSPDGTGRLFVVDQAGKVLVIDNGQLLETPFLDVTDRLVSPLGIIGSHDEEDFDERGLLGLAFHPDFAEALSPGYQKVYTSTSEPTDAFADFTTDPPPATVDHQAVIAEWTVDAGNMDAIDPASRREIMRIDEPQFNHNGGMVAFGPDGYLYISIGDGGAGNDVGDGHGATGNGQNINTIHGSIVRIDPLSPSATPDSSDPAGANGEYRVPVDNPFVGTDGVDEIFAWGFRNPFRFSFDTVTGRLIVGDVGQGNVEEVDIVTRGGNYGWNLKEGTFLFDPTSGGVGGDVSGLGGDLIDPVAEYDHDDGISVIGGYVYRGSAIPELFGKYVFGDFSRGFSPGDGRLFYGDLETGLIRELAIGVDDRKLDLYVKGLGQDLDGEVYVLASSALGPYGGNGVILKIVDLCTERIPGDINGDCKVDGLDLAILAAHWLESAVR